MVSQGCGCPVTLGFNQPQFFILKWTHIVICMLLQYDYINLLYMLRPNVCCTVILCAGNSGLWKCPSCALCGMKDRQQSLARSWTSHSQVSVWPVWPLSFALFLGRVQGTLFSFDVIKKKEIKILSKMYFFNFFHIVTTLHVVWVTKILNYLYIIYFVSTYVYFYLHVYVNFI